VGEMLDPACGMPTSDGPRRRDAPCANVPTCCLNEPEMSVRHTQSVCVGGFQTADLLAALGQLGPDQDELYRAAGLDRQALDRADMSESDGADGDGACGRCHAVRIAPGMAGW